MENFCRDINYYPEDPLNSLIRWAVYAYGFDFEDCINTNYPQLIAGLSVESGESYYARRKYLN